MKMSVREGIRKVLFDEMIKNKDMLMIGESMYYTGSLFSKVINEDFFRTFGRERILDCPVAEDAIIGMSFGAALAGMTVVPEIWAADFLLCIANELVNTIAKWRYQHRAEYPINMVVRAPGGLFAAGGGGPEHSQCTEAWLHNSPGLTIIAPSSVSDSMGLLRASIYSGDPVIFLEHRQVYDVTEELAEKQLAPDYSLPIGKAKIAREGKDVTIVAWSMMLLRAMEAAKILEQKGISAEIIDPRTIKPMDMDAIAESVRKTGRLIVAEESHKTGSIAGEIISTMVDVGCNAKYARLTMPDIPYHYIPEYEFSTVPSAEEIAAKAVEVVK